MTPLTFSSFLHPWFYSYCVATHELWKFDQYINNYMLLSLQCLQTPTTAGVYEARYYYRAMLSHNTNRHHSIYMKKAKFTVVACEEHHHYSWGVDYQNKLIGLYALNFVHKNFVLYKIYIVP